MNLHNFLLGITDKNKQKKNAHTIPGMESAKKCLAQCQRRESKHRTRLLNALLVEFMRDRASHPLLSRNDDNAFAAFVSERAPLYHWHTAESLAGGGVVLCGEAHNELALDDKETLRVRRRRSRVADYPLFVDTWLLRLWTAALRPGLLPIVERECLLDVMNCRVAQSGGTRSLAQALERKMPGDARVQALRQRDVTTALRLSGFDMSD
jgi:hypothetical protein